jgi:hypothetical protein
MPGPVDQSLNQRVQKLLREIEAQYKLLAEQRETAEVLREELAEERRRRHLAERSAPQGPAPTPAADHPHFPPHLPPPGAVR